MITRKIPHAKARLKVLTFRKTLYTKIRTVYRLMENEVRALLEVRYTKQYHRPPRLKFHQEHFLFKLFLS